VTAESGQWQEANREFLARAVDELHARIDDGDVATARQRVDEARTQMEHPPALEALADAFGLDAFERDVVLLCLASELVPRFRIDSPAVTVGSALELLDGANWTALDAAATLRSWGIVDAGDAPALGEVPPVPLAARERAAHELARAIASTGAVTREPPAVELYGAAEEDRVAAAVLAAAALGAVVATADVRDLPEPGRELDALLAQWSRWSRVTGLIPCLTAGDDDDPGIRHRVDRALARVRGPLMLSVARPALSEPARPLLRRAVEPLDLHERLEVWTGCLAAAELPVEPEALVALARDFRFGARTIARAALEAEAAAEEADPARVLRATCAEAVRARLDPVAERVRIDPDVEVVLPEREAAQLVELEEAIRLGDRVHREWGGADQAPTALFAGPSGTGKTHAAAVLAVRLGLDLYRVNLASVLSKYIGETEQNLERIFTASAAGGVILLFDEADALFGKRSEVRDSHDRYANVGTSYLLARLERTQTPTILTTNLKDAIDPAFQRRLQFVVDFPFPGRAEREDIWRAIYPPTAPVEELAPERLAAVAATGGTIANIARRGAYLAAAEPSPVEMRHLLEATRRELRKSGRDLSPEELEAWSRSA
jgi:SpoVK/Ycf46/Vps4 family AAA+-type ATPase